MNNPLPPAALASADTVKKITDFLAPELDQVQRILEGAVDSESRLIREVGDYLCLTRGKKLRPAVALLTAKALGAKGRAPVEVAAALELIHVATLVHDDVIDRAPTRRGKPSVNAQWGDDVAILMADYLYSRAFDLALTALSPQVMRIVTQVTQKMCEGEMFQIELREQGLTEEDYFLVVERKTGQLFSACAALGALAAGRPEAEIDAARRFGLDFGVAFQITDDALDFVAHDSRWGKEIGMDASGCKQTLPLLLALADANPEESAAIAKWRTNGHDLAPIMDIIQRHNGIERALEEARRCADRAAASLATLHPADPQAFELLAALPAYVVSREF